MKIRVRNHIKKISPTLIVVFAAVLLYFTYSSIQKDISKCKISYTASNSSSFDHNNCRLGNNIYLMHSISGSGEYVNIHLIREDDIDLALDLLVDYNEINAIHFASLDLLKDDISIEEGFLKVGNYDFDSNTEIVLYSLKNWNLLIIEIDKQDNFHHDTNAFSKITSILTIFVLPVTIIFLLAGVVLNIVKLIYIKRLSTFFL